MRPEMRLDISEITAAPPHGAAGAVPAARISGVTSRCPYLGCSSVFLRSSCKGVLDRRAPSNKGVLQNGVRICGLFLQRRPRIKALGCLSDQKRSQFVRVYSQQADLTLTGSSIECLLCAEVPFPGSTGLTPMQKNLPTPTGYTPLGRRSPGFSPGAHPPRLQARRAGCQGQGSRFPAVDLSDDSSRACAFESVIHLYTQYRWPMAMVFVSRRKV